MRVDPSAPKSSRQGDRLFLLVCLFVTGGCTLAQSVNAHPA